MCTALTCVLIAALVGIPWGKHKIKTPFAAKFWEGTAAMFAAALLAGLDVLCFFGHDAFMAVLPDVLWGAATGAATELFSPQRMGHRHPARGDSDGAAMAGVSAYCKLKTKK